VTKLKESFGLERVVLVGDRGMISHKAIGEIKDIEGMAWIMALKSGQIRGLINAGALQLGLFDEHNLFEFSDPKYPDERLIACRNPQLAKLRAHKRQALLEATTLELDKIRDRVARGALEGAAAIGVKLRPHRRTRHPRARHPPHAGRRTPGNLRYPHHADDSAAPRLRSDRSNHRVVRNQTPMDFIAQRLVTSD
jgi:hypothetical protein